MQSCSVDELEVRAAAMRWLDDRPSQRVDYAWLRGFEFSGESMPLMDMQRGIRKPRHLTAALSIRTVYTAPDQLPPYADEMGEDGFQRYKYRGNDPEHPENRALRRAKELGLPIIWFVAVEPGRYDPIYPVYVVGDEPTRLQFILAVHEGQRVIDPASVRTDETRRYVERLTKQRLHQRVFRSQIMAAYGGRCAICHLRHEELLDAAHIVPDGEPMGEPVVPNGLALCKIHHAAFDHQILGIRPDYSLHVRQDVLEEVDGWMLKGGIQGVHNTRLEIVPTQRACRPSPARLEVRYERFLAR